MKISVCQYSPIRGDIEANTRSHLKLVDLAAAHGADLVIFPELSLTGYEPELAKDLALMPDDDRLKIFQDTSTGKRIHIGIGIPTPVEGGVAISLAIFHPDRQPTLYSKKYLHDDELPFFTSNETSPVIKIGDSRIALAICYELTVPAHAGHAFRVGADVYIASAVKSAKGTESALKRLSEIAREHSVPVFFANCIGETGGYDCPGKSSIWTSDGHLAGQLSEEKEGILVYDILTGETQAAVINTITNTIS